MKSSKETAPTQYWNGPRTRWLLREVCRSVAPFPQKWLQHLILHTPQPWKETSWHETTARLLPVPKVTTVSPRAESCQARLIASCLSVIHVSINMIRHHVLPTPRAVTFCSLVARIVFLQMAECSQQGTHGMPCPLLASNGMNDVPLEEAGSRICDRFAGLLQLLVQSHVPFCIIGHIRLKFHEVLQSGAQAAQFGGECI